jgi:PAS domain S-box-containing protein
MESPGFGVESPLPADAAQDHAAPLKAAEAALREGEQHFRTIVDALPAAIYTTDAEGRITYFNPAAVTFSGRVPALGKDHWCVNWKMYRPDGTPLQHDQCPMAVALKEGRDIDGEEAIAERPDGTRIWFAAYPRPVRDDGGRVVGGINMLLDVTERKRAERARAHLAALVESSDDAIVSKDLNGAIASWNPAAELLFGYTALEAIGKSITMIIPSDRLDEETTIIGRIRRGERVDHYETVRRRKDGTMVDISLTVSPIMDANGRIVGASKIARDVTERKLIEKARAEEARIRESLYEQAQEANRAKDEFLATLSHELRTPLNAMLGWSHMMRSAVLPPATQRRALEALERNAKAQAQLVEDLLDVSRIVSGKLQIRSEEVDLPRVVAEAVDSVRPAAAAKGLNIEYDAEPETSIVVLGDADRLRQIVWNLLSNATKFTPHGGRIAVGVQRVNGSVEVVVRDTGEGIPRHFLRHVFERFRQAESSVARRHGGLGLGLAIVRHLTEAHGGSVSAASAGKGKGATFTVTLPVHAVRQRHQPSPAMPFARSTALRGAHILVVDDDADARDLVRLVLEMHGADVTTVASAGEALHVLSQRPFHVLIADIGMPEQDGYSLIEAVRALGPGCGGNLPAIAATAYASVRERAKALEAGYGWHIPKPIDPDQLVATVIAARGRAREVQAPA